MDDLESGREFVQLLELQNRPDLITRSELLEWIRQDGGHISPRTLTFYASEGLIPKAVRVGSRGGVYPKVVAWLLSWIVEARDRGISIEAIRELLPIWKFIYRSFGQHRLDLGELEYLVRRHINSLEAVYTLPGLIPYLAVCRQCLASTTLVRKDGTEIRLGEVPQETIDFILFRPESEDEPARGIDVVQMSLSAASVRPDYTNPSAVVVGVPAGQDIPPWSDSRGDHDDFMISTEPHSGAGGVEGGDR
jgi:DNA-binding transcriptional MerR regulator